VEGSAVRLSAFPNSTKSCPDTTRELDPYENLFPFNTYRINCNSFLRVFSRSGCGIEGPRVPGTNQFPVFDHALGQRASPMWAFIVQGADDAVDVGDAKCS